MSISRQNLTVVIVSFMSENVIHDCIQSIPEDIKIIVVDNSNNYQFKETIEKKYSNTTCILSENIGMGSGNANAALNASGRAPAVTTTKKEYTKNFIPPRPAEARITLPDISKAKKHLGYMPSIAISDWIDEYKVL